MAVLFRRLDRASGETPARPAVPPGAAGFVDSYRTVRGDSYLRSLAALAIVAGIVSTFIDWQSKAIIDNVPAAKANLASFFGHFNAGLLALTLLARLTLLALAGTAFGQDAADKGAPPAGFSAPDRYSSRLSITTACINFFPVTL